MFYLQRDMLLLGLNLLAAPWHTTNSDCPSSADRIQAPGKPTTPFQLTLLQRACQCSNVMNSLLQFMGEGGTQQTPDGAWEEVGWGEGGIFIFAFVLNIQTYFNWQ